MHAQVPQLNLTLGQVLYTLCHGKNPVGSRRRLLLDQLRYFRQLGVPFSEKKRGQGRGRPIHYSYEDLVEVAVGLSALRRGVRPRLVADYLVTNRTHLRQSYRTALEEQPATALEASWLKSHGRERAMPANERFLRLHHRTLDAPGTYELVKPAEAQTISDFFGMRELFPGGTTETLIPLTRLVLELVYQAWQVPVIRPGRKTKKRRALTPSLVRA